MARTTKAYRDGYKRGENAAGWWTQENGGGRDPKRGAEWAAGLLRLLDEGDCMALDSVACPVNLSGEWAGSPTPADVASLYARQPHMDRMDTLCSDWENGAQDGWMDAIYSHLRSLSSERAS